MNEPRLIFVGLIAIGVIAATWGLRIALSDDYFKRWQNSAWKSAGNSQWQSGNVIHNRYITGLGTGLIGFSIAVHSAYRLIVSLL